MRSRRDLILAGALLAAALTGCGSSDGKVDCDYFQGTSDVRLVDLDMEFVGFDEHVGRTFKFRLMWDGRAQEHVTVAPIPAPTFAIHLDDRMVTCLDTYETQFWVDADEDGVYDAPPVDPAWRVRFGEINDDKVVRFTYNTSFTDIRWVDP